ncbi:MAG: hypothetical protein QM755_08590 [Luteolibacter sp.]
MWLPAVTGLIKTIQQFRHEKIPALLHFQAPNPRIDFANSPFAPVAREQDWTHPNASRASRASAPSELAAPMSTS